MKARLKKRVFARRFSLILVLLLATAAWTVSNLAAQQQAEQAQSAQQGAEQTAVQPSQAAPDSPGPSQVAQPGQEAAEIQQPEDLPAQQGAEQTAVQPSRAAPDSPEPLQVAQPGQEAAETQQPAGASAQQLIKPVPAPPEQTSQVQAEQPAQAQAETPSPLPEPVPAPAAAAELSGPAASQTPDAAAPQSETAGMNYPPEYVPLIQKTSAALMTANFTFYPIKALDPFVPFLTPETSSSLGEDEEQQAVPLTPLQKMTLSEIERGLKAITWGELGKKAVIEDSTGRGYIVIVGTPAGEHSGVITQISNDHLVIQQEIWDRKAKKRFPQEYTIKLVKKMDKQK